MSGSGKDMVDAFASLERKRRLSKAPEEEFNKEQLARAGPSRERPRRSHTDY